MFRTNLCRLAAAIVVAGTAWSSRAPAQTLDSLVRLAVGTHPSLRAARLAIAQADSRARSAAAWEPPKIGVELSSLPLSDPNPFAKGETMLMAEQTIPLFGQTNAMAHAAALEGEVATAQLQGSYRELRSRVAEEYYMLWLLKRKDDLLEENRHHTDLLYDAAENRYTAGRGTQAELFRAKIERQRLEVEAKEIALRRRESLARLNALLARASDAPVQVADSLPAPPLPSLDSLMALLTQHPSVTRMDAMSRASDAMAEAQESMLRPMLMLRGGIGYMPEGHPIREATPMAMIGDAVAPTMGPMYFGLGLTAMISLPFAPWSRSGPAELAEANRLAAAGDLEERSAMLQELAAALSSAYAKAERAALRRDYYRQNELPLLDHALSSTLADFTGGRADLTSVVEIYHMRAEAYDAAYMQEMEYANALSTITDLTGVAP